MNVVVIPGLGGDKRLFRNFKLRDCNYRVLEFLEPCRNESIEAYSKRMMDRIADKREIIFIGVSLGGIVALEISKQIPVKKIILISSLKSAHEKPWYFAVIKALPLYWIVPDQFFKWLCDKLSPIFGTKTKEDKDLYVAMLRSASAKYLKWGGNAVLSWRQKEALPYTAHIHGNSDHIFPIRFVKPDYVIEGGQHFMIVQKGKEISGIVDKILEESAE